MKNFKLMLALADVLGAGSAFTTELSSQQIYFRTSEVVYEPLENEGPGKCSTSGPGCHFEKIGDDYQSLDSNVWIQTPYHRIFKLAKQRRVFRIIKIENA